MYAERLFYSTNINLIHVKHYFNQHFFALCEQIKAEWIFKWLSAKRLTCYLCPFHDLLKFNLINFFCLL